MESRDRPARGSRSDRWAARTRRGLALLVTGAVIVATVGACTPRDGRFTVVNDTDDVLLLWDQQVEPHQRAAFYFDASDRCFDDLVLLTSDLRREMRLDRTMCDGNRVRIRDTDLAPVRHPVLVRNDSSATVLVTFEGAPGVDERALTPGGEFQLALVETHNGCSDGRLFARAAEPPEQPVTYHPGPVCSRATWEIDDGALAAGPARVTVVNETDLTFTVRSSGVPGEFDHPAPEVGPGASHEVDLGVAPGRCVDAATITARAGAEDQSDGVRATVTGLCDGDTWAITVGVLERYDDERRDWVSAFPASVLASNIMDGTTVRVTVDGEEQAVLQTMQSERIALGAAEGACVDREVAVWLLDDDSAPLLSVSEVCDGDIVQVGATQGLIRDGRVTPVPGTRAGD